MSASTAVGVRRTVVSIRPLLWLAPRAATARQVVSPVVSSVIAGRCLPGCSVLKARASLKGSNVSLITGNTNRSRIDDFGLFTGQVGYAWNTALLYFKGGAAVIGDRNDLLAANGALVATSSGDNRWGGTVGAGIEFSFAPNWSAAVEYNHLFIANNNTTFINQNTGAVISSDHIRGDADLVSVRVNYRWGGPVVAKY